MTITPLPFILKSFSFLFALSLAVLVSPLSGQGLPSEYRFSEDGRRLIAGDVLPDGLYDRNVVREVHIDFPQANYWSLLAANYESETEIPASLTIDGIVYDSVGVRFRGNTSYTMIGNSQKKSFAIASDFVHQDQVIMGYKNLKFNNAHQDASFMREVLYGRMAKKYTPIVKTNYIHLFLNNQDWGLYPNIQSVDKTFLREWFLSNDGARFRATVEETGGGPFGGWGDGTAGMNYLGADTTEYQDYYDLKSADIDDPWQKLVDACQILSTATANNMETVNAKLDIDRTLWFLAVENIFADDDSYTMKGKMDYYVYYEPETDRTLPLEYDGNSSFLTNAATSQNWNPFKNVSNANYPLLNKLLNIPQWRQRYLAHYRTILQETFTTENASAIIDSIDAQIRALVAGDTKKLYSTTQYTNGIPGLKTFVTNRRNFLLGNAEVAQVAPTISAASYFNHAAEEFGQVQEGEDVFVRATVSSTTGVQKVNLYYSGGFAGIFSVTEMFDDGLHQDEAAADGIYGGTVPGFANHTLVRYYIEAIANTAALSASYLPAGAEHDVFVYEVRTSIAGNGVVINEIVASNHTGAIDEGGDHADWIELHNTNDFEVDLSGFYLSDDVDDPGEWPFPQGTLIPEGGYLIIWADDEPAEGPLHASWKVTADGETIVLSDPALNALDVVNFGPQTEVLAYARVPNGTGPFVIQAPTFSANNETTSATADPGSPLAVSVFPNPFSNGLTILTPEESTAPYVVLDIVGRVVAHGNLEGVSSYVDVSHLSPGSYFLQVAGMKAGTVKLIRQ